MRLLRALVLTLSLAALSGAGVLRDGVLTVDGKPFYPLGSWNFGYTTPEDIALLGMNTSFRGGPGTPEAVQDFIPFMERCAELDIQVVPYLSYGGAGVTPWPTERVRNISVLAEQPNLLCWYVGDDITTVHLAGIRQTVNTLREEAPGVATAADYIAEEDSEAKTTFTQYIDIRCQYAYPVTGDTLTNYLAFFDKQREFVGDPLWTWVQSFMWGSTGKRHGLGINDGAGPVPEPEQVRLLAHCAINRGVRGLLFFPHYNLHIQPELAAEVALTCNEVRLFNDHLAAGEFTMNLGASCNKVNATSFRYGGSTVVSAIVLKDTYHRWVDEAVVENVTIKVPWPSRTTPRAALVATPDVVQCQATLGPEPGVVSVTVPRLEVAGFILLTTDDDELDALVEGVNQAAENIAALGIAGSIAQARKVGGTYWENGFEFLYHVDHRFTDISQINLNAINAFGEGDAVQTVRLWRESNRKCRLALDSMMVFAESMRNRVPPRQRLSLEIPYSLRNIPRLVMAPPEDDTWNWITNYHVLGPFPLEGNDDADVEAPGFIQDFGPEANPTADVEYESVDGSVRWRATQADIAAELDFLKEFATTEDVVCYARMVVVSPDDRTVELSLGSNDGAKVWVNGEEVFNLYTGRGLEKHQNKIDVNLHEGENLVLVKVANLGASWGLALAFDDPDRELEYRLVE